MAALLALQKTARAWRRASPIRPDGKRRAEAAPGASTASHCARDTNWARGRAGDPGRFPHLRLAEVRPVPTVVPSLVPSIRASRCYEDESQDGSRRQIEADPPQRAVCLTRRFRDRAPLRPEPDDGSIPTVALVVEIVSRWSVRQVSREKGGRVAGACGSRRTPQPAHGNGTPPWRTSRFRFLGAVATRRCVGAIRAPWSRPHTRRPAPRRARAP